jgi:hypothetical protein
VATPWSCATLTYSRDTATQATNILLNAGGQCAVAQRSSNRGDASYSQRHELGQLQHQQRLLFTVRRVSNEVCTKAEPTLSINGMSERQCIQHSTDRPARFKGRFLPKRPVNSKKKKIPLFASSPACPYDKYTNKRKMNEWQCHAKSELLGEKPVMCPLPWI